MSNLTGENGMVMPVSPMYGNGGGGFGGWGDSAWIIILLLFAFGGGGFGGGFGGANGIYPWMNQAEVTQSGFNQAATNTALAGIQNSITQGFAGVESSACNRAMNQMQTDYQNQIASMNQNFANSQALTAQLNAMAAAQASCCCENRLGLANLGADIAREACADRSAVSDALKDVIAANNASTQRIIDMMNQDKLDAKNEKIAELQNQLTMAQLAASQNAQTATIQAGQRALANEVEQYVLPTPRPAYVVQNPNCCQQFGYCGCGAA